MKVRIVEGYKLVQSVEREFFQELESYNSTVEKLVPGYKIELVKEFKPYGRLGVKVYRLKYYGISWRCPSGKGKFRRGGIPVEIVDKVPAPPRFKLEGLEAIVENSDLIVEYRVFRRYRSVFEGLHVEPLDVDVPAIIRLVCERAEEEAERIGGILGRRPAWVPIDDFIVDVAEGGRVKTDDVRDSLFFAYDLGIVELDLGDGMELWFNIENSCLEVKG